MTDSIVSQIDQMVAASQSTAMRISADRTTGATSIEALPVAPSQVASSSGDVVPTTHQFNAEMATDEHLKLEGRLSDIKSKLAAVVYDQKTGAPSPKVTGRDREILEIQQASFNNEMTWLAARAVQQLPKVGDAKATQEAELIAQAKRQADIATLADSVGSDGKAIGRVAAAKLIDEAAQRALANKLVRS